MHNFPGGPVVKNPPANAENMNLVLQSLIQEDPTCHRTTDTAPQLLSLHSRAQASQQEKPLQ